MPHDLNQLETALAAYPRVALLEGPTPIQKLSRLSRAAELHGCNLYVKRDDLMGLGGGGNKLRKLEFLLGEALAEGADTLVTWGGFQSNHARLTAAVAARQGLACELILTPSAVRSDDDFCHNGNVLLDGLFGAKVHRLPRGLTPDSYAGELLSALKSQGKKPFLIPLGGSSPRGQSGLRRLCGRDSPSGGRARRSLRADHHPQWQRRNPFRTASRSGTRSIINRSYRLFGVGN